MDTSTPQAPKASRTQRLRTHISSNKLTARVVAAVVIAAIGFYGGAAFQQSHHHDTPRNTALRNGRTFGAGMAGGPRMMNAQSGLHDMGQVTAVSSSSITITSNRSGTSTTFGITSNTAITQDGSTITASGIKTGNFVQITKINSTTNTAIAIEVTTDAAPSSMGGTTDQVAPDYNIN